MLCAAAAMAANPPLYTPTSPLAEDAAIEGDAAVGIGNPEAADSSVGKLLKTDDARDEESSELDLLGDDVPPLASRISAIVAAIEESTTGGYGESEAADYSVDKVLKTDNVGDHAQGIGDSEAADYSFGMFLKFLKTDDAQGIVDSEAADYSVETTLCLRDDAQGIRDLEAADISVGQSLKTDAAQAAFEHHFSNCPHLCGGCERGLYRYRCALGPAHAAPLNGQHAHRCHQCWRAELGLTLIQRLLAADNLQRCCDRPAAGASASSSGPRPAASTTAPEPKRHKVRGTVAQVRGTVTQFINSET